MAISKAFTAAAARRSTRSYGEVSGPGGPAFGIHVSHQGRFMVVAGGLPVFVDDQIVGGVGCSSGHPDQGRRGGTGWNRRAAGTPRRLGLSRLRGDIVVNEPVDVPERGVWG